MSDKQSKSMIDVKLWKLTENSPKKIEKDRLTLEKNLEDWIEKDTTILSDDLLLIGRQVNNIDLLLIDRNGNTVIAELKREKTPRDIVSQIIEYASWVENLDYEDLAGIAEKKYGQSEALKLKFRERFDEELPEVLNEKHKMVIVAAALDGSTRKIVEYLTNRGIQLNVAIFHYFDDNGSKYMARTFLIEPSKLEEKETFGGKRKPAITMKEFVKNYENAGVGDLARKIKEIYDTDKDWDVRLFASGLGLYTHDEALNIWFNINSDTDNGVWVKVPALFKRVEDIGKKLELDTKPPTPGSGSGKIIRFNHTDGLRKLTPKFEELLNELKKVKQNPL